MAVNQDYFYDWDDEDQEDQDNEDDLLEVDTLNSTHTNLRNVRSEISSRRSRKETIALQKKKDLKRKTQQIFNNHNYVFLWFRDKEQQKILGNLIKFKKCVVLLGIKLSKDKALIVPVLQFNKIKRKKIKDYLFNVGTIASNIEIGLNFSNTCVISRTNKLRQISGNKFYEPLKNQIGEFEERLLQYLSTKKNVVGLDYDWRIDNLQTSEIIAELQKNFAKQVKLSNDDQNDHKSYYYELDGTKERELAKLRNVSLGFLCEELRNALTEKGASLSTYNSYSNLVKKQWRPWLILPYKEEYWHCIPLSSYKLRHARWYDSRDKKGIIKEQRLNILQESKSVALVTNSFFVKCSKKHFIKVSRKKAWDKLENVANEFFRNLEIYYKNLNSISFEKSLIHIETEFKDKKAPTSNLLRINSNPQVKKVNFFVRLIKKIFRRP